MKKLLSSFVLVVSVVAMPHIVMAGSQSNVELKSVGCLADGSCFANVNPAVGPLECTNRGQVRWDGTLSEGKNLTAAILTAKASGANVNIGFVDGECSEPNENLDTFPVLTFVTIR